MLVGFSTHTIFVLPVILPDLAYTVIVPFSLAVNLPFWSIVLAAFSST